MEPIYSEPENEITYCDHTEAIVIRQSLGYVQYKDDKIWFRCFMIISIAPHTTKFAILLYNEGAVKIVFLRRLLPS